MSEDILAQSMRDERGVVRVQDALLADISGDKRVGTGSDLFPLVFDAGVFVDKSLLVRDVLKGSQVTLFCRPRRFGKTLAATMLQDFFECAPCSDSAARGRFERLSIWHDDGGRWRAHQGRYPVVMLSLKFATFPTWEQTRGALANLMAREYRRHNYLLSSNALDHDERASFERIAAQEADEVELGASLRFLTELLGDYHGEKCMVIIDEYDAPITNARACGFYDEAVAFMRSWLTDALKTNKHLAHGVLTGVQRISKESIFSGLNNIKVSTPLNQSSDERFGFTQGEVNALAMYTGHGDKIDELKAWYDGYRFGTADVYNPWSVLSYLAENCIAQPYWTNTSGNSVLNEALDAGDADTLVDLLDLLNPGATVMQWIDPNIAYDGMGMRPGDFWSVLYMSGYLTTDDVEQPEDASVLRRLRVPNVEVRGVFGREVADRARKVVGSPRRLGRLHAALLDGDEAGLGHELETILANSTSYYDLTSEAACHMLLLGLLFGVPGYRDPVSNREGGYGRFDVQLVPVLADKPTVTIEVKHSAHPAEGEQAAHEPGNLEALARKALAQIEEKSYDAGSDRRIRWGVAFCGKHAAVACG